MTATTTRFVPGDPRAIEAGKKSGEARRAQAEARAETEAEAEALKARFLNLDLSADLGPSARACAALIIQRVALDLIPVRNGDEAAKLVGQLVEVARLEEGKATSHRAITVSMRDDERRVRIDQARQALPANAVPVVDRPETPSPSPVPAPPALALDDGGKNEGVARETGGTPPE